MDAPLVPEIDGYLLKLKHHRPVLVSAWNRRYFCTVTMADGTGAIEYYSHYKKGKPKKVILMSQITSVQKFDDLAFQINCQNQQSYLLRSESAAQLTCWVPPLQRHLQELSTYKNFLEYERRQKLDNNSRKGTMVAQPQPIATLSNCGCVQDPRHAGSWH